MIPKYKNSKPHAWRRLCPKADQITFSHWQKAADAEVHCASVTGNDIERGCACWAVGRGGSRLKAIAWELTALAEGWTWMGLKQCGHMPRERSDRRHCGHIQITGSGYIGAGVRLRRSESGVNHNQARVGVAGPTLSGLRGSSYPLDTGRTDGRTSLEDLGKDICKLWRFWDPRSNPVWQTNCSCHSNYLKVTETFCIPSLLHMKFNLQWIFYWFCNQWEKKVHTVLPTNKTNNFLELIWKFLKVLNRLVYVFN